MNGLAIAQLIASLLPSLINLYSQLAQEFTGQVPPLATILASADANWTEVATVAAQQANTGTATASGS